MKIEVEMYTVMCAKCGMPFCIPKDREERLRKRHNTFYCPAGHPQSWPQETDEEKLQRQVSQLRMEAIAKDAEISRLSKTKKKSVRK